MSVPVLSEQMHEVAPSVSTDYKFLTKTIFFVKVLAVIARATVTVAIRPSGTLATMIPIAKIKLERISYSIINPAQKKTTP